MWNTTVYEGVLLEWYFLDPDIHVTMGTTTLSLSLNFLYPIILFLYYYSLMLSFHYWYAKSTFSAYPFEAQELTILNCFKRCYWAKVQFYFKLLLEEHHIQQFQYNCDISCTQGRTVDSRGGNNYSFSKKFYILFFLFLLTKIFTSVEIDKKSFIKTFKWSLRFMYTHIKCTGI